LKIAASGWYKSALIALISAGAAATLHADAIVATYDAADVQAATGSTLCGSAAQCQIGEETFNSWNGNVPFTTNYSTSLANVGGLTGNFTGTYTGSLTRSNNYEWGGAGGTGYYPTVTDASYTVTLTVSGTIPGINYFGMWMSALDAGNELQIYDGNTLVYTFTAAQIIATMGACPSSTNPYCGNPNNGEDTNEQFAFLNIYDETGYFTKIVFTETTSGGFESDNHTVGYISTITPIGTVYYTPEPRSLMLLSLGILALTGLGRRSARGC
jgi:hypothetical protein